MANLSTLFTYGLPLNYYSNLAEQISVVDAQAVQDVAKKYLVPGKFVVIAVGDRAKVGQAFGERCLGTPPGRDSGMSVVGSGLSEVNVIIPTRTVVYQT